MTTRSVAVILAAGLGTRMKSSLPKVMHEVLGQPMIGHVVQTALQADCDAIAVVVGHGKERVEAYLRDRFPDAPLSFHEQKQMLGTGDAVRAAYAAYAEGDADVAVLCGDVPNTPIALLREAIALRRAANTPAVVITAIAPPNTAYGRIVRGEGTEIQRIVEFKDADDATRALAEINSGTYVFAAAFLRDRIDTLDTNNAQGEFYLTDLVERASDDGTPAHALLAPDIRPLDGVNNRVDLAHAIDVARERRNTALMTEGVTLMDPQSTWIDVDSVVDTDVIIEPNVVIRGASHVETGAILEAGVRLENQKVFAGRRVRAFKTH